MKAPFPFLGFTILFLYFEVLRSFAIGFFFFISYWLTVLPLGYILGMTDIIYPAMGASGFWIGIIFGLSVAALLLSLRLWRVLSKPFPHPS